MPLESNRRDTVGLMTIGQIAEIAVLALMPLVAKRVPRKTLLVAGLCAYVLRFAVFAYFPQAWAVIPALALHGFCFGCFLAVGYLYVDRIAPPDVRGSMQNIYGVFFVSIGFFVGGLVGGVIGDGFTSEIDGERLRSWTGIWLSGALLCAACVIALGALFPNRNPAPTGTG